jgi:A/G-specific adenine glycosylase
VTLSQTLVRWFRASHRDLPWRRTRDPYAIWVSEIMLQQTRVEVAVPYYEKFVARFPTAQALADAPLDDVLHAWAGLGYYRRARQLHAAAAQVVRDHGGKLPRKDDELRKLPGIGRYTVGAIRSIAFGEAAPIVDGNVARVFARLRAEHLDDKGTWAMAQELVPEIDPSAFNQGLMELGATVCTPRSPRCDVCPLAMHCKAYAIGRVDEFPAPKKRKATVLTALTAWIVRNARGEILMRRRGEDEHNAGFWEPPIGDTPILGLRQPFEAGSFRHAILHRAYKIAVKGGRSARAKAPEGYSWIGAEPSRERPWTTVARKAVARAGA